MKLISPLLFLSLLFACGDESESYDYESNSPIRNESQDELSTALVGGIRYARSQSVKLEMPSGEDCSGSFIRSAIILTASHCLKGNNLEGYNLAVRAQDYDAR